MLIRSQDKKNLCTLTHVSIIKKDKTNKFREATTIEYGIVNWIGNNYIGIGEYSTEEKAIKVLDMIQNAYVNYQYSKWVGYERETVIDFIFEMPKDDDLKA